MTTQLKPYIDHVFYNPIFNIVYTAKLIEFFPWLEEKQLVISFWGDVLYDVSPSSDTYLVILK